MRSSEEKLKQNLNMILRPIYIEEVLNVLDSLRESTKKDKSKLADEFLRKIGFGSRLCIHPIVRKCIDWGNLIRICKRTSVYKELSEVINKVISTPDPTIIYRISDLLEKLRIFTIGQIIQRYSEASEGLRHIHVPGSVARSEARNLYFGERYNSDGLLEMASRLCSSIAIGNAVAIYSEDEELMQGLRRIIASYLGNEVSIDLTNRKVSRTLNISRFEMERPFAILIRLLLWIKKMSVTEQDKDRKMLLFSIITHLRYAPITIFFMPSERARWRMITIPRLDPFFSVWLDDDEHCKNLENLLNSIVQQAGRLIREANRRGERLKAENAIKLVMYHYELLCERLLEFGSIDSYSARRIVDQLMELAIHYNTEVSFSPWRWII